MKERHHPKATPNVRRARELWLKTAVTMIGMGPPPRSALILRSSMLASGGGGFPRRSGVPLRESPSSAASYSNI